MRGPRDPADLDGIWRSGASNATLRIHGHEWNLRSGELEKWGTAEVTRRRVAFVLEQTNSPAFDLYCRETVDVYDWSLDEQGVVFRAVGRPCGACGAHGGTVDQSVTEPRRAPWPVRALRIVAWSWFVAGLVGAALIWLNARETVTTTRTITAHARLTFQDIEPHVSVFRASMGFVSLLVGLTVWAILLLACSRAEGPSGSDDGRGPSTSR